MKKSIIVISICSLLFTLYFMFRFASPYAATWDQVDFALALSRYDVFNMQPHFPGYPYFILGGMLLNHFIENPATALTYLNIILTITAIIPLYFICRKSCGKLESIVILSIILTASYINIFITQPMSEGAALAVLWWYIWSLLKAKDSDRTRFKFLPLLLFSILMGIRLSYLPFGIGIIFLLIDEWKKNRNIVQIFSYLLFSILFQLIWVFGVAATEGGLVPFIKLAIAFTEGHFTDWGGAATSEASVPIYSRLFILLTYNLLWTGISSQFITLSICYGIAILYIMWNRNFTIRQNWIFYMGVAYLIWALIAQNIDKPRHILPIIGIVLFYLCMALVKNGSKISYMLMGTILLFQTYKGYELMKYQKDQMPATYQLAEYLEEKKEKFVVYTWEEERVMDYLQVSYPYKKILTYEYFLADSHSYENSSIYVTNRVLEGFRTQGISTKGKVEKEVVFQSNTILDPIYGEITLYKWKK